MHVDDDGAAVAVRAFAPRERGYPNGSGHREEYTSGKELWSAPLEARPGAYLFLGTGPGANGGAGLHHPAYDFDDDAIPFGSSWFAGMVEARMPAA